MKNDDLLEETNNWPVACLIILSMGMARTLCSVGWTGCQVENYCDRTIIVGAPASIRRAGGYVSRCTRYFVGDNDLLRRSFLTPSEMNGIAHVPLEVLDCESVSTIR
jgi:hypothetical protein